MLNSDSCLLQTGRCGAAICDWLDSLMTRWCSACWPYTFGKQIEKDVHMLERGDAVYVVAEEQ